MEAICKIQTVETRESYLQRLASSASTATRIGWPQKVIALIIAGTLFESASLIAIANLSRV